jgi:hypothetical protein
MDGEDGLRWLLLFVEEDREVVVLLGTFVDFLCAGTFRLIFSSASRLSAWKSGWRKVQLYERKLIQKERGTRKKRTCSPKILSSVFLTL